MDKQIEQSSMLSIVQAVKDTVINLVSSTATAQPQEEETKKDENHERRHEEVLVVMTEEEAEAKEELRSHLKDFINNRIHSYLLQHDVDDDEDPNAAAEHEKAPINPLHDYNWAHWPKLRLKPDIEKSMYKVKRKVYPFVRRRSRHHNHKNEDSDNAIDDDDEFDLDPDSNFRRPSAICYDFEKYLLDSRLHPKHQNFETAIQPWLRHHKLTTLQLKIFHSLNKEHRKKSKKAADLQERIRKYKTKVYKFLLNEYNMESMIKTRSQFLKKHPYSNVEHYRSDDDTFEHALLYMKIKHPIWYGQQKEVLKYRRDERAVRLEAENEFCIKNKGRTCRVGIFFCILCGLVTCIWIFIKKEFDKIGQ